MYAPSTTVYYGDESMDGSSSTGHSVSSLVSFARCSIFKIGLTNDFFAAELQYALYTITHV